MHPNSFFLHPYRREFSIPDPKEVIPTADRQLLAALGKDDTDALAAIMDTYTHYVATVIHNQLGVFASPEDTEELTANVFVSLWQNRKKLRTLHLRGWLAAAARNEARGLLRKRKLLTVSQEDVLLVSGGMAERLAEKRERARFIRGAIAALGWPDREIFLRHYYYDQSVSEIGEEMELNPNTVKSRLRRGRDKLKEMIEKGDFYD